MGVEALLGFSVGMAEYLLFMLCLIATNLFVADKINSQFPSTAAALFALSIGVGEEVIFRGFIFQKLKANYGTGLALIMSSLAFGAYHIGSGTYGDHYLNATTASLQVDYCILVLTLSDVGYGYQLVSILRGTSLRWSFGAGVAIINFSLRC